MACRIAGIGAPARTGLAVMKPFRPATPGPDPMLVSPWLAGMPARTPLALLAVATPWPVLAPPQSRPPCALTPESGLTSASVPWTLLR